MHTHAISLKMWAVEMAWKVNVCYVPVGPWDLLAQVFFFNLVLCALECRRAQGICEGQRVTQEVSSLLPPCGIWESNTGYGAGRKHLHPSPL